MEDSGEKISPCVLPGRSNTSSAAFPATARIEDAAQRPACRLLTNQSLNTSFIAWASKEHVLLGLGIVRSDAASTHSS